MIENINVDMLYLPWGLSIPWETETVSKTAKAGDSGDAGDDCEVLFFELLLESPPPNTVIEINPSLGQVIIAEKKGTRAMIIPLGMVCAVGDKGSVILAQKQH